MDFNTNGFFFVFCKTKWKKMHENHCCLFSKINKEYLQKFGYGIINTNQELQEVKRQQKIY